MRRSRSRSATTTPRRSRCSISSARRAARTRRSRRSISPSRCTEGRSRRRAHVLPGPRRVGRSRRAVLPAALDAHRRDRDREGRSRRAPRRRCRKLDGAGSAGLPYIRGKWAFSQGKYDDAIGLFAQRAEGLGVRAAGRVLHGHRAGREAGPREGDRGLHAISSTRKPKTNDGSPRDRALAARARPHLLRARAAVEVDRHATCSSIAGAICSRRRCTRCRGST